MKLGIFVYDKYIDFAFYKVDTLVFDLVIKGSVFLEFFFFPCKIFS